jgi:hypothetical protein
MDLENLEFYSHCWLMDAHHYMFHLVNNTATWTVLATMPRHMKSYHRAHALCQGFAGLGMACFKTTCELACHLWAVLCALEEICKDKAPTTLEHKENVWKFLMKYFPPLTIWKTLPLDKANGMFQCIMHMRTQVPEGSNLHRTLDGLRMRMRAYRRPSCSDSDREEIYDMFCWTLCDCVQFLNFEKQYACLEHFVVELLYDAKMLGGM